MVVAGVKSVRSVSSAGLSFICHLLPENGIFRAQQMVSERLSAMEKAADRRHSAMRGQISSVIGEIIADAIPIDTNKISPWWCARYADWSCARA